jgi:UDP-N-acetylglucosamine/UDP-N-acetylgalactosamine diphosphorylase
MSSDASREQLQALLEPYGQSHVLRFWDQLDATQRDQLVGQLAELDLDELQSLIRGEDDAVDFAALARRAEPPPAVRADGSGADWSPQQARAAGEEALRSGRVAVLIVAGGQGTRLGFDHPKGMFPIGPVSGRTLFQSFADRLRAVEARYGQRLPLLLMTSPATHEPTLEYLRQSDHLGLPPEQLHVFQQGTMPAVDAESGKLLLAAPDSLALSPDGHGGTVKALAKSGTLERLGELGVTQLFYAQVDNPLVPLADPEILGHHLRYGSEMTTLVVRKRYPTERVGNAVQVDGQAMIIEYSDLPEEAAEIRGSDGELKLWAGNIAVHVFNIDFLKQMAERPDSLPFHRARKKVPFVDESGQRVAPEEPNAIKFERFIFDLLPRATRPFFVEGVAAEVFAPVKNADGAPADTPAAAREQICKLHAGWLAQAGVPVAEGVQVEIDPRLAIDAATVAEAVAAGKLPPAGSTIESDTYFHA